MMEELQDGHRWLQRFVGEWSIEVEAEMESGETERSTGTESVRSLGGRWIVAEGTGTMPGGGEALTLLTLGYDAARDRYPGTWVGSMMDTLWIYDGELDASGRTLTLSAEGPSMKEDGQTMRYRDVHEFVSDDHRTLTGYMEVENGEWKQFMTAHYRRA